MNTQSSKEGSYRSLQILEEISKEQGLSQRDLSKKLDIAVGLVNSYIKNFVAKGCLRVTLFPRNRYKYLLTPEGIAEKSRLTYKHLHYFTSLYTTARRDFQRLFHKLEENGVKSVLFCGTDEVAEIAYLSLQETGVKLVGIVDTENCDVKFFQHRVENIECIDTFEFDRIIVSSLKRGDSLTEKLKTLGIDEKVVCHIEAA